MALSSKIIPYLALLSLVVSCVPGLYWGFRRLCRHMKKKQNQQDEATLFLNRQQLPHVILLDDDPHFSIPPHHQPSNSGRHRVSSATSSAPSYLGRVPVPEYRAVWLSAAFFSPYTEWSDRLYTDQSYQRNATWFEYPDALSPSWNERRRSPMR